MAEKNYVVVDGSNLATEGRKTPSLAQLDEAVRAYAQEDPDAEIVVVVDATFEHRIDPSEVAQFEQAELHGELVSPPAGAIGRGDAFVLRIAERTNAAVLSNDSFQEFHGEHGWLFDEGRLIGGKPVPGIGWIFTPRTPVRGPKSRKATSKVKGKGGSPELVPAEKAAELAKAAKKMAKTRMATRNGDGSKPKVGDVWVPPMQPTPAAAEVAGGNGASDVDDAEAVGPVAKATKKAAAKAGKAAKATKATKATKKTVAAAGKATKPKKATKAAAKVEQATKVSKTAKAEKAAKAAKPAKAAKAAKAETAAKPAKAAKATKTTKASKAATVTKAATVSKVTKATKASKAAAATEATKTTRAKKAAKTTKAAKSAAAVPETDDHSLAAASPRVRAAIVDATAEAFAPPPEEVAEKPKPLREGTSRKRRRRSGGPPPAVNEPLAFINFVAAYPVGSTVEGEVASFTSHGAMVEVSVPDGPALHCYVPLSGLGSPAPVKARDVVSRGERLEFVLVALDPPRRVAELALPAVSAAALAAAE